MGPAKHAKIRAKGDERCGLGGPCHTARPDIRQGTRSCALRAAPWMLDALRASGVARLDPFPHGCGAGRTRSRAEPPSGVRRPCPVQRLGWSIRSGASGVARLDPPFVVLYSALSIIAPSVNVLHRTRRKPSTIRGAAPDVVIGQSTANRLGARPYQARAQPQIGRARWLRR